MDLELDPPQPPIYRLSSTCDRHPDECFTGFCPSCLRERLSSLESTSTTSTTHRNSTSTISSSLKSIFSRSSAADLELRRCKSFACGRAGDRAGDGGLPSFEPQRRSCDVRGHSNAWSLFSREGGGGGEIEVVEDEITIADPVFGVEGLSSIERGEEAEGEVKPMKEHIHLESQVKKPPPTKDLKAGTFWLAASVFSKKLQNWRRKQKLKKIKKQEEKAYTSKSSRRFCESQSEVAVDALGRRSCDFAPRYSLDAGRISFDDARYSIDEPRASWDTYMLTGGGGRSLLSRVPPMLAVVEDMPMSAIQRSDGQIPVEEDLTIPGGSAQTKDYYLDTSSRSRRRSLDRSHSLKKLNTEVNDPRQQSNARVSPAGSSEFFRDWSSTSLKEDRSESFDSAYRVDSSHHNIPPRKKSNMWSKARNIWGLINRRSSSRENINIDNVVERSLSESWPELRTNGNTNGLANGRLLRSNSTASSRNPIYGSMRMNGKEKKRDEFVLERNRSAKYSPRNVDNGMLRFYLAPMSGSRRGLVGNSKGNSSSQSFTRSVIGLY